jgi:hypothetical protein
VKSLFSLPSLAIIAFGWSGLGLSGCDPGRDFSVIPEIAPKSVVTRDSLLPSNLRLVKVLVTITWQDGDGDLGVMPDNTDPNDLNYIINLYKRKNGEFVRVDPLSSFPTGFNGRFPNLNPEGSTSTKAFKLRGELRYDVKSPGFTVTPPTIVGTVGGVNEALRAGDVIRFTVQIKDRAGHASNEITTQEVTL